MIKGNDVSDDIKRGINEESLSEVFAIAERHDIANIVGEALFKNALISPDTEIAQKYKKAMLASVVRYQRLCFELKRIGEVFEENQIPYMPLKGSVIRNYYPDPWMRTSVDVDILVKQEDYKRAEDLLENHLNFRGEELGMHDRRFFTENNICIELHFDLIERKANEAFVRNHKFTFSTLEQVWETSSVAPNTQYRHLMSNDIFYFYHISHIAKHFIHGGCGVRPFIDLWILENNGFGKNENLAKRFSDDGLTEFYKQALELAKVWFGNNEHTELTKAMEEYIFSGGVYGTSENRVALKRLGYTNKIRYFLPWIFVPYSSLKTKYKGLEKYPFLLPFYWVYRIFERLLTGNFKKVVRENQKYNNFEKDDVKKIETMFSKLDII